MEIRHDFKIIIKSKRVIIFKSNNLIQKIGTIFYLICRSQVSAFSSSVRQNKETLPPTTKNVSYPVIYSFYELLIDSLVKPLLCNWEILAHMSLQVFIILLHGKTFSCELGHIMKFLAEPVKYSINLTSGLKIFSMDQKMMARYNMQKKAILYCNIILSYYFL